MKFGDYLKAKWPRIGVGNGTHKAPEGNTRATR